MKATLHIQGDAALLDAIRRYWVSLWTDRAVAYRAANRIDQRSVLLAVVVQRIVPAQTARVLFTANPLTGGRRHLSPSRAPAQPARPHRCLAWRCFATAQKYTSSIIRGKRARLRDGWNELGVVSPSRRPP